MALLVAGFVAAVAGLVALYMARPRYEPRRLSAARFFQMPTTAPKSETQLRISNPLISPAFWLQLLILTLLFVGCAMREQALAARAEAGIGIWFWLDSSASMSTRQEDGERFTVAQARVEALFDEAMAISNRVCAQVTTFDLQSNDHGIANDSLALQGMLAPLEVRLLGTNLELIRLALTQPPATEPECPLTHLVVVSDQPAPVWAEGSQSLPVVWIDMSQPTENVGFTVLRPLQNPITGAMSAVEIEMSAYGTPPSSALLQIVDSANTVVLEKEVVWQGLVPARTIFTPPADGLYTLTLDTPDSYTHDNFATIMVTLDRGIAVEWQLPPEEQLDYPSWRESTSPQLRITAAEPDSVPADEVPTLFIGGGYNTPPATTLSAQIGVFREDHPLLATLNFDVAETVNMGGVTLPAGWTPVLMNNEGAAWVAIRPDPPAVLVPGLPPQTDASDESRFATTLFFNAVRWLLNQEPPPPLYTTTTPAQPLPEGNRLALHPEEGNTSHLPLSVGDLRNAAPASAPIQMNLWSPILACAFLFFLLERYLSRWRGHRWS